jgi:tetratricopeptide (TPR) repeat protein
MRKSKNLLIVSSLVSLLTILVYLPALQNDFVNWDDDEYVYENPAIQSIGIKSIKWMFTAFHSANWHPLTWFSHAIDYAIWGLNPMGHHLTGVIFHGLNTFLVVVLITRLISLVSENSSRKRSILIASAMTGLLFGLHPIHVESVAWVSERKDVLYAFFFVLSILMYIKYVSAGQEGRVLFYGLCLGFFMLSLMSKPMAVTLPAVLLILDFYPLKRLDIKLAFSSHRKILMEKLPFLGLSIASIILTVLAQQEVGAIKSLESDTLQNKIFVAFRALIFYVYKILWPKDLAPLYPYPASVSVFMAEYAFSILLVSGITACCVYLWRRQKIWLTVWAYYIITLLPVLGIIKVGSQAAADRYTYLASLGPFLIAGLGVSRLIQKIRTKAGGSELKKTFSIITITTVLLALLASITIGQIKIWKNSIILWKYELELFPDSAFMAYYNLGRYYLSNGLIGQAIREYNSALTIRPHFFIVHNEIGVAYKIKGLTDKAIKHYKLAIRIRPYSSEVHNNLANAYLSKGLFNKAIRHYEIALESRVDFAEAHYNLAIAYQSKGLTDKADEHFRLARQLNPALVKEKKTQ